MTVKQSRSRIYTSVSDTTRTRKLADGVSKLGSPQQLPRLDVAWIASIPLGTTHQVHRLIRDSFYNLYLAGQATIATVFTGE